MLPRVPNMVHYVWRGSLTVIGALNGRNMPTDDEWDSFVATYSGVCDARGKDLSHVTSMAISDGGAPTSKQRQKIAAAVGTDRRLRWVLLSTSRLARGVAVALSWFQPDFKVYAPEDFHRALRFLGLHDDEGPSLLAAIREADRPLGLSAVAELALEGLELNS